MLQATLTNDIVEDLIDFPSLFERSVERWAESTAIVFESEELSYADLNALANRIARVLEPFGVANEQRVGLCLDRSHRAIAAMIGVMKTGGAFVPLDPDLPPDRLAYMVQDAGIESVICDSGYCDRFSDVNVIDLDVALNLVKDDQNLDVEVSPDQLAYVMYTSGSTGKPKGVQIEHRSLATYCFADIDVYEVVESDRTLQFSTINFDIAVEEIFPPLLTGSCVVVRPSKRSSDQNELSSIINKHGVTAVHVATAYWHEWVDLMRAAGDRAPESLRLMVVTGEKISTEHVRRWHELCDQDVLWCNAYGPTEATVSATVFIPPEGWDGDNMPIGKPLKRYTAHILDDKNQPVGDGETGELCIGGPALARGYLNRPDLTDKAFFETELDGERVRLYRSGDLARWLPSNEIEFAGRIDDQIKLGSYRIEPGEIEAAINTHGDVLESFVSYDEVEGKKYLIAYIATGGSDLSLSDMTEHLRDRLPPYIVPQRFIVIERFPKTINGKINKKELPSPDQSQMVRSGTCDLPRNELEEGLVRIWKEVLNVPLVGIHDDFFALGGSSLLVTRVISQVQSHLNTEIPVRDFFANPTIASIASHMNHLAGEDSDDDEAATVICDRMPKIRAGYISSGSQRLFAVHYPPVFSPDSNKPQRAVVICGAYGHEYQRSYRNLQQLAVILAQTGIHVVRFDYTGTGNSSGSVADWTVEQWQNDIRAAFDYAKEKSGVDTVSLLGMRTGAVLAATSGIADADRLILWDPVNGDELISQLTHFHQRALTNFRRFNCRNRRANPGQLYGHAISQHQRVGLSRLRTNPSELPENTTIVLSCQQTAEAADGIETIRTEDEIFWSEPKYAEAAFSSPRAYQIILQKLESRE